MNLCSIVLHEKLAKLEIMGTNRTAEIKFSMQDIDKDVQHVLP